MTVAFGVYEAFAKLVIPCQCRHVEGKKKVLTSFATAFFVNESIVYPYVSFVKKWTRALVSTRMICLEPRAVGI